MKHKHHIIPKHAGGTDDPSNLIELTVEEHAEAHRKLWEQYGRWQDKTSWMALSKQIGKEEIIKQIQKNANLGRKHTDETREKMASAKRGKKITPGHLKVLNEGRRNSKNSEEHIAVLKTIWKNKNLSEEHKTKISDGRKCNPKVKELASNAGKISAEKYKNDPERQKAHSENMKLWWAKRKQESVGT